ISISPAYIPGSITINGLNLGSTALGYALRSGSAAPIQIIFNGQNASAANPGGGWTAIAAAAAPSGAGYALFWYNSASKQVARWLLNGSGNYSSGNMLTPLEVFTTETALGFDLDKDGITGVPLLPIARVGEVTLGEITQGTAHYGFAVRRGQSAALPITIQDPITLQDQIVSYSNPGAGWEPAAASSEGEGYKLYWHNHASNTYAVWNLSANASLITGTLLGGADVTAAERSLNIDISHNGVIGTL
ncbi:MAG: hypothetical protein ACKO3F_10000, partial [Cyanobium sp.]